MTNRSSSITLFRIRMGHLSSVNIRCAFAISSAEKNGPTMSRREMTNLSGGMREYETSIAWVGRLRIQCSKYSIEGLVDVRAYNLLHTPHNIVSNRDRLLFWPRMKMSIGTSTSTCELIKVVVWKNDFVHRLSENDNWSSSMW